MINRRLSLAYSLIFLSVACGMSPLLSPTAAPTAAPTSAPTPAPTLRPFSEIDLADALVKPQDLTFSKTYAPDAYVKCADPSGLPNAFQVDDALVVRVARIDWMIPNCVAENWSMGVEEWVWIIKSDKQAERLAEQMAQVFAQSIQSTTGLESQDNQSTGYGRLWVLRGSKQFVTNEFSDVLVSTNDAVIYLGVIGDPLVEADLVDLAAAAVARMHTAQAH